MSRTTKKRNRLILLLGSLMLLVILLAACGGATAGTASPGGAINSAASGNGGSSSQPAGQQKNLDLASIGPLYLIKALKVNMEVKDTWQVATDLQSWISTTDPRSTSAGIDYEQVGNNLYNISITFSVQATLYPQIERYLADYPAKHDGRLLSLTETVQDVTNDYIDSQSRLKNLRSEQERLLALLHQATALSDVLSIQQQLTDVEGQIEQIEAHINQLNGQVTFYNIAINLQPPQTSTSPVPSTDSWNAGSTFHDALTAAKGFGEVLVTVLIWLSAFSVYIIPAAALVWFVWWRRRRPQHVIAPPAAPAAPPQTSP